MAFSYSPKIVTDGLVFAVDAANKKSYPGSGTTWADLAGANDGTLINGPTFDSGDGGSIVFDGSNDRVSTNYNEALNDFTICAWFKGENQGSTRRIADKSYTGGFWLGYHGGNSTTGYWGGGIRQSGAPYGLYIGPFDSTRWNFISMKREGTTQTLNGNGLTLSSSQTVSGNSLSTDNLLIGYGGGQYMNGNIAIVKIYNRALSSTEVTQNYNALKSRFGL
jgi:hypothetical protein